METKEKTKITVQTTVNAPVNKVWASWSLPEHITQWCQASDDWHCPAASNDLRPGGSFRSTMAARDGSFSFEFGGIYDTVTEPELIEYTMGDGRKVKITFTPVGNSVYVEETFEAEDQHPAEMQQQGWQAILNNFKSYTETL